MDFSSPLGYTHPMRRVYLDNASTSFPKAPGVIEAMTSYMLENGANPNRGSYESSYQAMEAVMECRSKLAFLFCAPSSRNVVFSLNVTSAINMLVADLLTPSDHVLVSSLEHNAVMRALTVHRIPYSMVPCDGLGRLSVEHIGPMVRTNTKALLMTSASNVSGTVQPIYEAGLEAHRYGLWVGIDSAQGTPTVPCRLEEGVIDAIAFTAHKGLAGPQGVGGLVLSERLGRLIRPSVGGGTGSLSDSLGMPDLLPDKLEAGTQNTAGILGLSAALDFLPFQGQNACLQTQKLVDAFLAMPKVSVLGPTTPGHRVPLVGITVEGQELGELAYRLSSQYGIEVRCGLHCAPCAHLSLGTFESGTLRFSCSFATTDEDIEVAIQAMKELLS